MEQQLRLPDIFPRTSRKCADVSGKFFSCFSDESLRPEALLSTNPLSGHESLIKCQKQLRAYETCMKNDKNVKIPQEYRVCTLPTIFQ